MNFKLKYPDYIPEKIEKEYEEKFGKLLVASEHLDDQEFIDAVRNEEITDEAVIEARFGAIV